MSGNAEKLRNASPDKDRAPRAQLSKDVPDGRRGSNNAGGSRSWKQKVANSIGHEDRKSESVGGDKDMWKDITKAFKDNQGLSKIRETLTFDALFKRYELAKAFSLNPEQVRSATGGGRRRTRALRRATRRARSRGRRGARARTRT